MDINDLYFLSVKLNEINIKWALGGSLLLYFNKILDNPRDIDILVNYEESKKVNDILYNYGECREMDSKTPYKTESFYNYKINNTEVDIIGSFKISHERGIYSYILDEEAISQYISINNIQIPLSSIEDWYILYQLIPDREKKVSIIEEYLNKNGVSNPKLIKRALEQPLPQSVIKKCLKLL
ncbi:hypothetical protein [Clostridium sp. Marseille-Q7071]